jgi:hypothetical protein
MFPNTHPSWVPEELSYTILGIYIQNPYFNQRTNQIERMEEKYMRHEAICAAHIKENRYKPFLRKNAITESINFNSQISSGRYGFNKAIQRFTQMRF